VIVASLMSGCGDGAITGAHVVEMTSHRSATAAPLDCDGAVGELEQAMPATRTNTLINTRTIATSVTRKAVSHGITIQVSCQRRRCGIAQRMGASQPNVRNG